MKNVIVPFEIAIKLKKLGYNEPTHLIYNNINDPLDDPYQMLGYFGQKLDDKFQNNFNNHMCSAPTFDEVVIWLYDTYNFFVGSTLHYNLKSVNVIGFFVDVNEKITTHSLSQKRDDEIHQLTQNKITIINTILDKLLNNL